MVDAWGEKDLLPWAKRTLPELLVACVRDPAQPSVIVARTPWENLAMDIAEVEVDGEMSLCGKRDQGVLEFDLVVGMRINVTKDVRYFDDGGDGATYDWPAVVQILHFEAHTQSPEIVMALQEVPEDYVEEVEWYLREGMGQRYLWRALAAWRSSAIKTWLKKPPPPLEEPMGVDFAEPLAFRQEDQRSLLAARFFNEGDAARCAARGHELRTQPRQHPGAVARAPDVDVSKGSPIAAAHAASLGEPASRHAGDVVPGGRLIGSCTRGNVAPMTSMLAGVGGPGFGQWSVELGYCPSSSSSAASRGPPRGEIGTSTVVARATALCEAIADMDFVRAFALMDEETLSCRHPESGRCALHWCVLRNAPDLVRLALAARAAVDVKDAAGRTALMLAAQKGSAELTRLLADAGAGVAERDLEGRSAGDLVPALNNVQHEQRSEVLRVLGERERPTKFGAALVEAIKQKDVRSAEAAIDAGGDVNFSEAQGDSPLVLLAKGKWGSEQAAQAKLAERLVRARADVNAQNEQGGSPLHFAAHRGSLSLLAALLDLRASPALANHDGSTALMFAAHGGREEICRTLLEAGAAPEMRNGSGLTAEAIAAKRGFGSCAVLIQAYALAPRPPGVGVARASAEREAGRGAPAAGEAAAPDISRWSALERRMAEEEEKERRRQQQACLDAMRGPAEPAKHDWVAGRAPPKVPEVPRARDWDYGRWEKIVEDAEKQDELRDQREHLLNNPQYVWKNGVRMRVIV